MDKYDNITIENSVKKQFDLSNKNVVITGGGGFLGYQFSEAIAEMNGTPILLDISDEGLNENSSKLKNMGAESYSYKLDLTDKQQIISTVQSIIENHQKVDVLINNAAFAMKNLQSGGDDFFAPFEEYEQNLWEVSLNVNLTGTFLVTQQIGGYMKKAQKGNVINIASDVAVISPDHRIYQPNKRYNYDGVEFNTPIAYSVSKSGILAFSRYLATYWAQYGIRVNSLSPAGVYRNQDNKFIEQLEEKIPLGRMALPQELKGAIVFLASNASTFMTGHNLILDGGRTIW